MKNKTLTHLLALLVFLGGMVTANAITIDSTILFGTADPGAPANPGDEESRLEEIIKAFNIPTAGAPGGVSVSNGYDSSSLLLYNNGSLVFPLSDVVTFQLKNEDEGNSFNHALGGDSYEWLAIKQGTLTSYYNISGVTDNLVYGSGWSHYSLFNQEDPPEVPDSGTTLILLGAALAGLGLLKRRN